MSKQVDAEVKGIFDEALARYKKGEKTYGVFDKDNDPRNFLKEAEEELLDAMNYAAFEIARIRAINAKLNEILSLGEDVNPKENLRSLVRSIAEDTGIRPEGEGCKKCGYPLKPFMCECEAVAAHEALVSEFNSVEDPHYEPLPEKEEPTL